MLYGSILGVFGCVEGAEAVGKKIEKTVFGQISWIGCGRSEDSLFVKMPLFPLRKSRSGNLFRDQLRESLNELMAEKGIPEIPQKCIQLFHLHNSTKSINCIPDNDNYDVKCTIDEIIRFVGGGDGGTVCSLFMDSLITDEFTEGTYIAVTPKSAAKCSFESYAGSFSQLIEHINSGKLMFLRNSESGRDLL